jgi:anti-anti-sigma factor
MVSELEVQDAVCAGRHTVMIRGELDGASAPMLEEMLSQLGETGAESIVLDLSRLAFMDSAGMHAILVAHELCRAAGCEFLLVSGRHSVQRLFEAAGLVDVLRFEGGSSAPVAVERRNGARARRRPPRASASEVVLPARNSSSG